jgi:hypothetical protein
VNDPVQNTSRELSSRCDHGRTLARLSDRSTGIGGVAGGVIPYTPWGRATGTARTGTHDECIGTGRGPRSVQLEAAS